MSNQFAFVAGDHGPWRVLSMKSICGAALEPVKYIDLIQPQPVEPALQAKWMLRGITSNVRYAKRAELSALRDHQSPLGRKTARRAALLPIKKSNAWWELAQDERRAIFEEASHHTAIGMEYLPAIARQLFHCRDLQEPFDFLTWFEYAPEHTDAFDALLHRLRATIEWSYVEREIDIRLERVVASDALVFFL
jgi:Chlorite dismutase